MISDRMIPSGYPTARGASDAPRSADELASVAAGLLASAGSEALTRFDPFPGALYATDRDGRLIYFNDACVALTGRTPQVGVDRWCICAGLRSIAGDPIAPDQGPLAGALREGRALRNIEALVEHADGGKIPVRSFPTPAFAEDGRVVGAVNLLVPSDGQLHRDLLATALRCRTLAKWIGDRQANDALTQMAEECDQQAQVLRPD